MSLSLTLSHEAEFDPNIHSQQLHGSKASNCYHCGCPVSIDGFAFGIPDVIDAIESLKKSNKKVFQVLQSYVPKQVIKIPTAVSEGKFKTTMGRKSNSSLSTLSHQDKQINENEPSKTQRLLHKGIACSIKCARQVILDEKRGDNALARLLLETADIVDDTQNQEPFDNDVETANSFYCKKYQSSSKYLLKAYGGPLISFHKLTPDKPIYEIVDPMLDLHEHRFEPNLQYTIVESTSNNDDTGAEKKEDCTEDVEEDVCIFQNNSHEQNKDNKHKAALGRELNQTIMDQYSSSLENAPNYEKLEQEEHAFVSDNILSLDSSLDIEPSRNHKNQKLKTTYPVTSSQISETSTQEHELSNQKRPKIENKKRSEINSIDSNPCSTKRTIKKESKKRKRQKKKPNNWKF